MHDALEVHPNVRVLEPFDAPPTTMAIGKEREGIARDLIEKWIVAPAREGHREGSSNSDAGSRISAARPTFSRRRNIPHRATPVSRVARLDCTPETSR